MTFRIVWARVIPSDCKISTGLLQPSPKTAPSSLSTRCSSGSAAFDVMSVFMINSPMACSHSIAQFVSRETDIFPYMT
jgi:hypothetical protein